MYGRTCLYKYFFKSLIELIGNTFILTYEQWIDYIKNTYFYGNEIFLIW